MNILYFSQISLLPLGHGNIATVHEHIKRLKLLGHKVHYVFYNIEKIDQKYVFLAQQYVDTLDVINCEGVSFKFSNNAYEFDSWYQNGIGERICDLCKRYNANVIICSYIMQSKILDFVPRGVLKIIDTHDKMTDRYLLLKKNGIPLEFFSCTSEDEARYLNRADIVWARTNEERDYYNHILGKYKCITVSHFKSPLDIYKSSNKIETIGFLASCNNVNAIAVVDFAKAIITHKRFKTLPIKVIVGGKVKEIIDRNPDMSSTIKQAKINLIGYIENNEDFYKNIDLAVTPIMFGTGINVKTVEAISYALPIVSTNCGMKGLSSNSKFHHADNLHQLCDFICDLWDRPNELLKLSSLSKTIYKNFYNSNTELFDACFRDRTKKRKFLLLPPDFTFQSFGDQAMLLSFNHYLISYYPNAEIGIFNLQKGHYNDFISVFNSKIVVHNPTDNKFSESFASAMSSYDELIVFGADVLDGSCGVDTSLKYYQLINIAHNLMKPIRIINFSFDTVKSKSLISKFKAISEYAIMCVRDTVSYSRLLKLGFSNLIQSSDLAFLLDKSFIYVDKNRILDYQKKLAKFKDEGAILLAINFSCSKGTNYKNTLAKIAESIVKTRCNIVVVILPHDLRLYDDRIGDVEMSKYIVNVFTSYGIKVLNLFDIKNEIEIKNIIDFLDLIITSRMHLAIAALSSKIPAISFDSHGKFEGLYSFYNFEKKLLFNVDEFNIDELSEAIIFCFSDDVKKIISNKNVSISKLALNNFHLI